MHDNEDASSSPKRTPWNKGKITGPSCVSAWNKDPVFGVIGVQSGPPH